MKIFWLRKINSDNFADYSHIGTWSKRTIFCEECEYSNESLIEPLQIEWNPGSDNIGHFSWCGSNVVVLDNVKLYMEERNYMASFKKVVVNKPEKNKKKVRIVPYPYTGPQLYWMVSETVLEVDLGKSDYDIEICPVCNREDIVFEPNGICISEKSWSGEKFFYINEYGNSVSFMTEEGVKEIEGQAFSNFHYEEAGFIA